MIDKILRGIRSLRFFGFKIRHFAVPMLFTVLSAGFDGVGMALLIPLGQGVINRDFTFVKDVIGFREIFELLPQLMENQKILFAFILFTIVVSIVLKVSFAYVGSLMISFHTERFINVLRKSLFARYLDYGKLFFDQQNFGKLNNVLFGYIGMIGEQLRSLYTVLGSLVTMVIYIVVMIWISWRLTLISFLIFPFLYFILRWLVAKIKKTSKEFARAQERLTGTAFNVLTNIPLVKLYSAETAEKRAFRTNSDAVANFRFSMNKKQLLIPGVQELFTVFSMLILISFVAFMVMNDPKTSVPKFAVFFILLRRTGISVQTYNAFLGRLAALKSPIEELRRVMGGAGKPKVYGGETTFSGLKHCIECRDLSFSYIKGLPVLKDLSFTIEKEQMTAFVGPSGSGKTTLISLLLRFYDVERGRLFVDGEDIKEFAIPSLRKEMALVSQETLLFNDTVANNITYGLKDADPEEIRDACSKARLDAFLDRLPDGLNTMIGDRGVKLSGGEKQRVSIARALLKNAPILILDEATSSLDTTTEKLIQEAIDAAVVGRTSIVIAHRLSTIQHADKIVVIDKGRKVEEGDLAALLENQGLFYRFWRQQKFH